MLEKTSVSVMVLLVAASLIGIAGIYLYVEGQGPPAVTSQPQQQIVEFQGYVTGKVSRVINYGSSVGKACIAVVQLPSDKPNILRVEPGSSVYLSAPNESFCTLFGLSKIGKTQIIFDAQKITASSIPRALQADPVIPKDLNIYRITRVDM